MLFSRASRASRSSKSLRCASYPAAASQNRFRCVRAGLHFSSYVLYVHDPDQSYLGSSELDSGEIPWSGLSAGRTDRWPSTRTAEAPVRRPRESGQPLTRASCFAGSRGRRRFRVFQRYPRSSYQYLPSIRSIQLRGSPYQPCNSVSGKGLCGHALSWLTTGILLPITLSRSCHDLTKPAAPSS